MSTATVPLARAARPEPSLLQRLFGLDLLDNRYPQLHGLRVLAIVSVVQYHVTSIFAYEASSRSIARGR